MRRNGTVTFQAGQRVKYLPLVFSADLTPDQVRR
jgi:hypothetical protein